MGVKVKGNMYCNSCKKKVMAQKQGHGVRNTVGAAWTLGLSIKVDQWSCPFCGGKARPLKLGWDGKMH